MEEKQFPDANIAIIAENGIVHGVDAQWLTFFIIGDTDGSNLCAIDKFKMLTKNRAKIGELCKIDESAKNARNLIDRVYRELYFQVVGSNFKYSTDIQLFHDIPWNLLQIKQQSREIEKIQANLNN